MRKFQEILAKVVIFVMVSVPYVFAENANDIEKKEDWWICEDYKQFTPTRIAVLPMDNLSLETETESFLYQEVYKRLSAKGYIKISVEKVHSVMEDLGIQTPGQLSAISPARLGKKLNCDALMMGRIDQSGTLHMGVYDALVISCSLKLVHCSNGKTLWTTEQWRSAHRQWQGDPVNLLFNFAYHENTSRQDRVEWLVQEMFKTLPPGPVQVIESDLLDIAIPIQSKE